MYIVSRGSGYPVLFIHGIPTSCRLWDGVMERMAGEFTCLAVDLPGLGRSAGMPHRFRELDVLASEIEGIRIQRGIEKWHVVGHDAGCAIAIHYAHEFHEHVGCLAMLSPSVFPDLKPFYLFEILRKRIAGELLAPLINLLFWRFVMLWAVGRNPEQRAALADFHAPFRGRGGGWRLMSLLRWGDPADVLAQIPEFLPRVMVPALILHGSRDPAVPEEFARRASGMLANSEVVVLNTGHFLPMNEPARIARELLCFFEKHGDWASCLVSGAAGVTDGR